MAKASFFFIVFLLLSIPISNAQIKERERPEDWDKLVFGGRFMDRILALPNLGGMTEDTWGADAVVPRDVNNGIEDKEWSYWGGNARLLDDGKYHLFVCRWPEDSPKGHMEWSNSKVVHAVAENSYGPYKVIQKVGKGHNPEWYVTNDGKYVVYVIGGYYVSDDVNGPWEFKKFDFNTRDRKIIEGLSNLTFAQREDGSFVMVCRGGGIWISKDGLSEWNQISNSRVYPDVQGHFEDPLIWKTEVQYHLIVNDWLGRIAWYMRSKDGIHWKTDAGEAYLPGIANHTDGTTEDWFKYERIKVLLDKYGRATQAHFAVIDTIKWDDKGNDNHSSKHITIPLSVGKRISILKKMPVDADTKKIRLLVRAEEGFDPHTDIDLNSLRFGAPEEIDFGGGSKVKGIKKQGPDAIITFYGEDNGITETNFAGKMLGKTNNGALLFGYSRLPGVKYIESFLSAQEPKVKLDKTGVKIKVQNFGQIGSKKSIIDVFAVKGKEQIRIGTSIVSMLEPYESNVVEVDFEKDIVDVNNEIKYLVLINGEVVFRSE